MATTVAMPAEEGSKGDPFTLRSRYTDTWILVNGKWRVVASQLTALK